MLNQQLFAVRWNKNVGTFLLGIFFLLNYLMLSSTICYGQKSGKPKQITGQVKDEGGETMPGVSVAIDGGKSAVLTDMEGKFVLKNVVGSSIIVFSAMGYQSEKVEVGDKTTINLVLKVKASNLDEVVVIGYGTVKRGDLTGAVGAVNMTDLQKAPVLSFDQALAGRIAGVDVSSDEGQPGDEGTNIVIRGGNSLTQDNSPLYVVDGFPIESFDNSSINPDEIESITVLKDASSTAIYGARGANGVIVIETKKGLLGTPQINYNGSFGFQEVTKTMDVMSPYDFVRLQEEISPTAAAARYYTGGKTLESYKGVKGFDWQEQIFRTGQAQIQNLSLRGGNAQTKYSISGSVNKLDGIIINSGQNRYQGRVSVSQTISKKLKGGVNINYSSNNNFGHISSSGGSASSAYMYSVWGYRPVTSALIDADDDDEILGDDLDDELIDDAINPSNDSRINPIISVNNEIRKRRSTSLNFNAFTTYDISPELTLRVTGGLDLQLRRSDVFNNSLTQRGSPLRPTNIRGINGSVGYSERSTWLNENTLNWKKKLSKRSNIDALAGFTMQGSNSEGYGFSSQLISNEVLGMSGLDTGTPYNSNASSSENGLVSFLGRVNYSYNSKYLFTASIRGDASSKFPVENRWGYFPSGAVAWKVKSEPFMKKVNFIYDLKLRASYGFTGNNRVSDFASLSALGQSYGYYYSYNNATPSPGISPSNIGNANLKWETTEQADLGLDISFLRNRIELTVDAYRKITRDLLLNADLPFSTGFTRIFQNIGSIKNQGLEFTLNTVNIDGKFKWGSNLNISFNRNEILGLASNQENRLSTMNWENSWDDVPLYIAEVGGPAAMFYGFIWDGIYQPDQFENGVLKKEFAYHGLARETIQPGDIRYKDLDGDGVITQSDQTILGRALPIHSGGFSNNFYYKGFSLNVFFQWKYGNNIFNANRIIFEGNQRNSSSLNQYASYNDRWTPENLSTTLYRVGGRGPASYYSSNNLEDGSYIRLKTVQLSYEFPGSLSKKVGASKLSLNVSAQNLHTWTNYNGMDPEVGVRNTTLTPGFDYSAYPRAKTIVFGVKASF